jgi:hypothetical protein
MAGHLSNLFGFMNITNKKRKAAKVVQCTNDKDKEISDSEKENVILDSWVQVSFEVPLRVKKYIY